VTRNQHAELVELIRAGFGRVEARMSALEGRMEALEGRVGLVEERLGLVEERLGLVEDRVTGLEVLAARNGRLLRILVDHTANLAERVTALEMRQARIEELMTEMRLQIGMISPAA
jgi:hypothetical protein